MTGVLSNARCGRGVGARACGSLHSQHDRNCRSAISRLRPFASDATSFSMPLRLLRLSPQPSPAISRLRRRSACGSHGLSPRPSHLASTSNVTRRPSILLTATVMSTCMPRSVAPPWDMLIPVPTEFLARVRMGEQELAAGDFEIAHELRSGVDAQLFAEKVNCARCVDLYAPRRRQTDSQGVLHKGLLCEWGTSPN